jgi:hypothetical protein
MPAPSAWKSDKSRRDFQPSKARAEVVRRRVVKRVKGRFMI